MAPAREAGHDGVEEGASGAGGPRGQPCGTLVSLQLRGGLLAGKRSRGVRA